MVRPRMNVSVFSPCFVHPDEMSLRPRMNFSVLKLVLLVQTKNKVRPRTNVSVLKLALFLVRRFVKEIRFSADTCVLSSMEGIPDALLPITNGPENSAWERWFQPVRSSRNRKWWSNRESNVS
ncbi:hypothetical protein KFK09_011614 [Dendrobium nobile]|uniref:Uncharacterized protein n=1 Tax=Dendrobium nobile TaxID=94219 RepID=A0A8T3BIN5_DENNO|nr:hypothetical protein KFK09_011614 [Dendrobium nobile]